MANKDIILYAKQKGITLSEIAKVQGISEATLTRLLRTEVTGAKKAEIIRIIDALSNRYESY